MDACGKPSTLVLITQCDLREVYYVNKSSNEVSDSVHTNATQATRTREKEREREKVVTSAREETRRRPGKKGDQSFEQRKRSCYSLIMLYLWEMAFI